MTTSEFLVRLAIAFQSTRTRNCFQRVIRGDEGASAGEMEREKGRNFEGREMHPRCNFLNTATPA